MGFNDLLKKAKDTASNAANTAKAKYDEKKQAMDAQKAERGRIAEEMCGKANEQTNELLNALNANTGDMFAIDKKQLIDFTAEYYDKLYLPAHSVSSSKLSFHPLDKKIQKAAQKEFPEYTNMAETPVFMISGKNHQCVFMSADYLYFKKCLPDSTDYCSVGKIPVSSISSLDYSQNGDCYIFSCNGVELMNTNSGFLLDLNAFSDYSQRIANRDFVITDEQIDALIKTKIGENILKIVREYIPDDELLLYFAWGGDSITAKDFIVCSDKQMVVLDREAFGLTKNVKQFYYDDVTSMATLQETNGLLDLALTAAFSFCDLEISVAGAKEKISTLFTYEAEKVIRVYRNIRKSIKDAARQPQVIVQQAAAPVQDDPLAQLEKLNKLKEAGILTDDEFNAKKADLLAKL